MTSNSSFEFLCVLSQSDLFVTDFCTVVTDSFAAVTQIFLHCYYKTANNHYEKMYEVIIV